MLKSHAYVAFTDLVNIHGEMAKHTDNEPIRKKTKKN